MSEIDDAQQAEYDSQAQAQHCVERAVDEADQQLAEECLKGYSEDHRHGAIIHPALHAAASCDPAVRRPEKPPRPCRAPSGRNGR
ncbi:CagY family CD-EC repeat-containing protein [Mesorhizobium sp. M0213]|uniref:CagY family CD-EC repeat-containing protein n=1 Tax=unclassified Mesorhizobium TaxID=325217 RepID=UPI00333979F5